jgi:hypothetical protein
MNTIQNSCLNEFIWIFDSSTLTVEIVPATDPILVPVTQKMEQPEWQQLLDSISKYADGTEHAFGEYKGRGNSWTLVYGFGITQEDFEQYIREEYDLA